MRQIKEAEALVLFRLGCYRRLPRQMQRDLWSPFFGGYEQAYDAAVVWLTE